MEHNGIYELARNHQGEIRCAVVRARVAEHPRRERRTLGRRVRTAYSALMTILV